MVASLLDLQEAARMRAKGIKHMRCRLAYLHDVADNDGLAGAGNRTPARGRQLVMVADDMIDFVHRLPAVRRNLRRAAGDDDPRLRIVAARTADSLTGLPLGFGRHGAGVENDGIVQPGGGGLVLNNLGFPDIQPATEAFHPRCVPSRHAASPAFSQVRPKGRRRRHRPPDRSSRHGGCPDSSRSRPCRHPSRCGWLAVRAHA